MSTSIASSTSSNNGSKKFGEAGIEDGDVTALEASCSGCPCGVLCALANFNPRPQSVVVEGLDMALVLNLSFGYAFVDAPLIGGVEFL